jgi:hypothetical protein
MSAPPHSACLFYAVLRYVYCGKLVYKRVFHKSVKVAFAHFYGNVRQAE